MKKIILFATFFITTVSLNPLRGQGVLDTLRYSQESGTLQKQRFIDQYDYVFMTKEPTKWMFRVGSSQGSAMGGLMAAYERKLSPSMSFVAGAYFASASSLFGVDAGAFGELRYYYDMSRRIKEGKSANNFSGNYFGLTYYSTFDKNGGRVIGNYALNAVAVRWGMQRRFFKRGLVDLGLSLSSEKPMSTLFSGESPRSYSLRTHRIIGLAWGDFKTPTNTSKCIVFNCQENYAQLWKINWPTVELGTTRQEISLGVAYEHRIINPKFSVNFGIDINANRWNLENRFVRGDGYRQTQLWLRGVFQPRYYWNNKGINNLSGGYLALSLSGQYDAKTYSIGLPNLDSYSFRMEFGPTVGFQQKIFKRGYLDMGLTQSHLLRQFNDLSRNNQKWALSGYFQLGFAF